jgi:hypothetical protein
VSNRAPACIHCGCPLGEALDGEYSQSEQCEIVYDLKWGFRWDPKAGYYFWARAIRPGLGEYAADISPRFRPGMSASAWFDLATKTVDLAPRSDDKSAVVAHQALVQKLIDDGWGPVSARGEHWWSDRFRRRVPNLDRLKWPMWLYPDENLSRPARRLPVGARVKVIRFLPNAALVRTEDGEEGYLKNLDGVPDTLPGPGPGAGF